MPPPRIAIFFGDVLEDIDMADLVLLIECEQKLLAVKKDEAGKRRDDRRVSLV